MPPDRCSSGAHAKHSSAGAFAQIGARDETAQCRTCCFGCDPCAPDLGTTASSRLSSIAIASNGRIAGAGRTAGRDGIAGVQARCRGRCGVREYSSQARRRIAVAQASPNAPSQARARHPRLREQWGRLIGEDSGEQRQVSRAIRIALVTGRGWPPGRPVRAPKRLIHWRHAEAKKIR
jgi:hypothetical protein